MQNAKKLYTNFNKNQTKKNLPPNTIPSPHPTCPVVALAKTEKINQEH